MCFINDDYDWQARVYEKDTKITDKPIRCQECNTLISIGDKIHAVYMREYEECRDCYNGDCLCLVDKCCQCTNPTFGEECNYHRCASCEKFLTAVHDIEIDGGCSEHESVPPLGNMIEYIQNGHEDEAKKYFKRAIKEYPELKSSGYLGLIWNKMFVN